MELSFTGMLEALSWQSLWPPSQTRRLWWLRGLYRSIPLTRTALEAYTIQQDHRGGTLGTLLQFTFGAFLLPILSHPLSYP